MKRRSRHRLASGSILASVLALFLAFLSACPGGSVAVDASADDANGDAAARTGTVEIGTGTVSFMPMEEESDLILWAGVQGGYHFIVHARIQDLEPGDWQSPSLPENPSTTFFAFDESGRQVDLMLPPYALGFRDEGDGWFYFPSGRFLRVENELVPELYGSRVRIRVEVEDASGATAVDERWVHVISEPQQADAGVPDAL